jgi:hypothetical protein
VSSTLLVVRRSLLVPSLVPVAFVVAVLSWAGIWLARESMGATDLYLAEVRHGCLLFAGTLTLALAEPLRTREDVGKGALLLRYARSGELALVPRWIGLGLACLPLVAVAAVAAGGLPSRPGLLAAQLMVLAAGGLALGALLQRGRLVPALFGLLILGHLRPWIHEADWGPAVTWVLPRLAAVDGVDGLLHAALWSAAMLFLAHARLVRVAGRG